MCCNPAIGRVDFEDGWLIKSSFITEEEQKTKGQKSKNKQTKRLTYA